jgi:tyrosine-protein phosphatase SIW14
VRPKVMCARSYTAALLAAALLSIPLAAQGGETARQSATANLAAIRIDNFGQVDSNYYRGAQPKASDYDDLASLGLKAIINLTSDDSDASEKALAEHAGMKYFAIPMTTHQAPTAQQLAEFLSIVAEPANLPVYVHCVGGRHRTGVMTAAYRMTHDGWTADRAFAEMKLYKFGADFLHPEFKEFVYGYRAAAATAATAKTASVAAAK